jgi:hypothetical protein
MPTAFVLINTEIGSETDVLKELKNVEGVEEEPFAVYGVYDIVARVKADTMERLKRNCYLAHSPFRQITLNLNNDWCRRKTTATVTFFFL